MRHEITRGHCKNTSKYESFYLNQASPEQSTLRRGSRMKPLNWAIKEALLSKKPPCKVLDVGCLHGTIELVLAPLWYNVTAIDIVQTYLDESKKNSTVVNEWVDYKLLPVEKVSSLNTTFDLIICLSVFEHVADFDLAFEALNSVAAEGTVVLATVPIEKSWLSEEHTRIFRKSNLYDYFPKNSEITTINFSTHPNSLGWFAIKYII